MLFRSIKSPGATQMSENPRKKTPAQKKVSTQKPVAKAPAPVKRAPPAQKPKAGPSPAKKRADAVAERGIAASEMLTTAPPAPKKLDAVIKTSSYKKVLLKDLDLSMSAVPKPLRFVTVSNPIVRRRRVKDLKTRHADSANPHEKYVHALQEKLKFLPATRLEKVKISLREIAPDDATAPLTTIETNIVPMIRLHKMWSACKYCKTIPNEQVHDGYTFKPVRCSGTPASHTVVYPPAYYCKHHNGSLKKSIKAEIAAALAAPTTHTSTRFPCWNEVKYSSSIAATEIVTAMLNEAKELAPLREGDKLNYGVMESMCKLLSTTCKRLFSRTPNNKLIRAALNRGGLAVFENLTDLVHQHPVKTFYLVNAAETRSAHVSVWWIPFDESKIMLGSKGNQYKPHALTLAGPGFVVDTNLVYHIFNSSMGLEDCVSLGFSHIANLESKMICTKDQMTEIYEDFNERYPYDLKKGMTLELLQHVAQTEGLSIYRKEKGKNNRIRLALVTFGKNISGFVLNGKHVDVVFATDNEQDKVMVQVFKQVPQLKEGIVRAPATSPAQIEQAKDVAAKLEEKKAVPAVSLKKHKIEDALPVPKPRVEPEVKLEEPISDDEDEDAIEIDEEDIIPVGIHRIIPQPIPKVALTADHLVSPFFGCNLIEVKSELIDDVWVDTTTVSLDQYDAWCDGKHQFVYSMTVNDKTSEFVRTPTSTSEIVEDLLRIRLARDEWLNGSKVILDKIVEFETFDANDVAPEAFELYLAAHTYPCTKSLMRSLSDIFRDLDVWTVERDAEEIAKKLKDLKNVNYCPVNDVPVRVEAVKITHGDGSRFSRKVIEAFQIVYEFKDLKPSQAEYIANVLKTDVDVRAACNSSAKLVYKTESFARATRTITHLVPEEHRTVSFFEIMKRLLTKSLHDSAIDRGFQRWDSDVYSKANALTLGTDYLEHFLELWASISFPLEATLVLTNLVKTITEKIPQLIKTVLMALSCYITQRPMYYYYEVTVVEIPLLFCVNLMTACIGTGTSADTEAKAYADFHHVAQAKHRSVTMNFDSNPYQHLLTETGPEIDFVASLLTRRWTASRYGLVAVNSAAARQQ